MKYPLGFGCFYWARNNKYWKLLNCQYIKFQTYRMGSCMTKTAKVGISTSGPSIWDYFGLYCFVVEYHIWLIYLTKLCLYIKTSTTYIPTRSNYTLPKDVSAIEPSLRYDIQLIALELPCIGFKFPSRTFWTGITGFMIDCPSGVWSRGLTTIKYGMKLLIHYITRINFIPRINK